jgi:hygromycin-B 4-O-kinase
MLYQHIQHLLDYLPTERYLVYGSCDLSNILAQDGQITATIDWVDAQYGDFVYDIVTLDFWCPWLHVSEQFEHYCQQRQIELLPSYQQRLLCYQCYLALGAIRFYASSGNEKGYRWIRDTITQKLNASSNQAN